MSIPSWKSIKTAPRIGVILLAEKNGEPYGYFGGPVCHMGFWQDDNLYKAGGYWKMLFNPGDRLDPTLWMPLPEVKLFPEEKP